METRARERKAHRQTNTMRFTGFLHTIIATLSIYGHPYHQQWPSIVNGRGCAEVATYLGQEKNEGWFSNQSLSYQR